MSHLQKRQSIIQEKRKKTPFRDFVMEICSRYPLMFYKNNGLSSTIRSNDRVKVTSYKEYEPMRDILISDDLSQQGLAK
jgi:hypothetical protein